MIELTESLTPARFEEAWRQAQWFQHENDNRMAELGMTLARSRDPRYMKALEAWAEFMVKASEDQHGRTKRSLSSTFGEQRDPTEVQMVRESYRLADEGNPIEHFRWVYGAAAWLAGYGR